jgi:hypothetical protein
VIDIDGNRLTFVGCGSVEPPDTRPLASRLLAILRRGIPTPLAGRWSGVGVQQAPRSCLVKDSRMIGKLKGLIDSYGEDYVILDVGGVG